MSQYFMSFEQARIFVHALGFKTKKEWYAYCDVGSVEKPSDIPRQPHRVYKNKGWVNWIDWLGTDRKKKTKK